MVNKNSIKLFGGDKIRAIWNDEQEKWYFSVVDVVAVLTESKDFQTARKYWNKLKQRLKEEGFEPVTNCHQLKMPAADGKMRLTDVADTEQLLRIIQSVPSPKAEPFKMWLAKVGAERLDQMQDPELSIQQAMIDYKRLGYSDNWINQRLKSIEIRKDLTDQWKLHNVEEGVQYATLTDIIYQSWAGRTSKGMIATASKSVEGKRRLMMSVSKLHTQQVPRLRSVAARHRCSVAIATSMSPCCLSS